MISNRSKAKVIRFMDKTQFERGFIIVEGSKIPAIRFSSGIVHSHGTRRGVRVNKRIAATFQKDTTNKDVTTND